MARLSAIFAHFNLHLFFTSQLLKSLSKSQFFHVSPQKIHENPHVSPIFPSFFHPRDPGPPRIPTVSPPGIPTAQAAQRILAALREAHGGRLELGGPAEVPGVAKAERFVQPTIVVDPKKVPRVGGWEVGFNNDG